MDIFNIDNFMPHGHCYLWQKDILLSNVISDFIITVCYLAIPIILAILLSTRKDIPFRGTIKVFILFIFFCALTHVMEIVNVWYPYYALTGVIKSITAVISVFSTIILLKDLKKILVHPSLKILEENVYSDMSHVMQKLPVGVIFSDSNGMINYHNDQINEIFKFSKEEIENKEVEVLMPQELKQKHYSYKKSYFENPTEKKMGSGRVLTGRTKDGETKFLEIGLRPIFLKSQNKDLTIITIKDITQEEIQRRKLEETLKLFEVATFGLPSLLSYIDINGRYQFVNDTYEKLWGIETEKIIGEHYLNFLPIDTADAVKTYMESAFKGNQENFNITVNFPTVGLKQYDVFYIPHRSKETDLVEGVVVLSHDITELNEAMRKLEISNKQLEEYAFLVSHDLRAPVRHINNFTELLNEQINNQVPDKEKISRFIEIIQTNSIKIQNMISGMLKIASLNSIKPNFEKINIVSHLEEFSKSFNEEIDFEIDLNQKESCELDTDKELIDSIFNNLFENSVNHKVSDKAKVHLSFERHNNEIVITYQDFGSGIKPEFIKSMYIPFTKSQDSKGLGLGMTIVTRSLERIRGNIECIPSDEGARFEIRLKTVQG